MVAFNMSRLDFEVYIKGLFNNFDVDRMCDIVQDAFVLGVMSNESTMIRYILRGATIPGAIGYGEFMLAQLLSNMPGLPIWINGVIGNIVIGLVKNIMGKLGIKIRQT